MPTEIDVGAIVAVIAAIATAAPLIMRAINQRKGAVPKEQADAITTVVDAAKTLVDPLNDRIRTQSLELVKARNIDRIQCEIIRAKGDYISHLETVTRVLHNQLIDAKIKPAYKANGEQEKYRQTIKEARIRLKEMELWNESE